MPTYRQEFTERKLAALGVGEGRIGGWRERALGIIGRAAGGYLQRAVRPAARISHQSRWRLSRRLLAAGASQPFCPECRSGRTAPRRVIVVSACYSGSFIDDLKDENSLIITASRSDRTSFGCSNENDYTYFGEAYFDQQLRQQWSFVDAFPAASQAIAQREEAEGLTPPSEPQMHVGAAIRSRLSAFEQRIKSAAHAATN